MTNKNILFLSFYFEPDLSAGSFRNTLLAQVLQEKLRQKDDSGKIVVLTSKPNRYGSYRASATEYEEIGNILIHRINVGKHRSGFIQQAIIYISYAWGVFKIHRKYDYTTIYASSSRLMTAFLGAMLGYISKKPLFLDIRDIFRESLSNIFPNKLVGRVLNLFLKAVEKFTFKQADAINVVTPDMKGYFEKFKRPVYCFTNGIDEVFFNYNFVKTEVTPKIIVCFAGNIGKAQALHNVIPQFARTFSQQVIVRVIGDGSGKGDLLVAIDKLNVKNVEFIDPIPREDVLIHYKMSDFLFLHLDDKEAFYRAIPTKLFEYAATGKTIIAGVKGFAQEFVLKNIKNTLVFNSNDYEELISKFEVYTTHGFESTDRSVFVNKFRRKTILEHMANEIYLLHIRRAL